MAAVMHSLRKNLQKPDRAFQCSPSFFSSACILAASLLDADHALPFLSSSSSISCYLPCPPSCCHLTEHQRRPPTFPVLSFFPFSLSAHHHHPSSPALPLFSASSPHPIALSPPRHHRLLPPSLPHLHRRLLPPSWSIPLLPPLSLLCCSSFASPKSFCGLSRHRQEPPWLRNPFAALPSFVRSLSLFSPSASAPSSLIDAAAVASFIVAPPPPTKTSCRHRLPYSSSTDVVAASLFLHRCPASPPATQEDPRPPALPPLLVSASVHCHKLEPKMGIS